MSAKDIIDQICREKTITLRALAEKAGIDEKKLYNINAGRVRKVSHEMAAKIHAIYPEYSLIWLLTGEQAEQESGESNEQAKRIAELESELQKANERIDLLLSMLAKQQNK